ncbi:MAG TPA: TetR/AcrR family transcriptional regulator [bacterium]|nr:TetR/AcrR family transcriptional regulator [bacterium]
MKKNPLMIDHVPLKRLETALSDPASPPGRILRAAEDIFAERGFKAATTREIAGRAGVNIATIHYYWGSKDELCYAVIYHVMTRITELTQGLLDLPAGDLEGGIRNIVGKLVDIFADNPNYARLLQHRTLEGINAEIGEELFLPILNIGLGFVKKNRIKGFATNFAPALVLFSLQGALRIFFQEKDSVKAIFGEDPLSFSPAFRQQLKDLLSSLALHVAGLSPGNGGDRNLC